MKKDKIIYLAGILDGEGCLSFCKYAHGAYPRCEVTNTSKELIDWLQGNFGGHTWCMNREGNRKLQYRWKLRSWEMREIMPLVYPYLIIKKRSCQKIIKYYSNPNLRKRSH